MVVNVYYSILDDFEIKENSICVWSNKYDNFNHLALAKIACAQDPNCIGIHDQTGDGNGPFQLCKYGLVTPESSVLSCIYKKKNYEGW